MTKKPDDLASGTRTLEQEKEAALTSTTPGALIRRAANLPDDDWPDARLSAVRAYAGKEAKTVSQLVVFLATAQRYNLDPIVGQLYLINSESGPKVCTGRDTWVTLARRERGYMGMQFSTVHANDEFGWERLPDGGILVHHKVKSIARGALVGAYALVKDGVLGQNIEVREMKDFSHLMSKNNWKNYAQDMIVNRCIAAVLRKQYSFPGLLIAGEEDELLPGATQAIGEARTIEATQQRAASLKEKLAQAVAVETTEPAPPAPQAQDPESARIEGLLAAQRDGQQLTDDELEEINHWRMDHPEPGAPSA